MNVRSPSAAALRPPTARGQRTRQLVFDAAERVFGEKGFEHASIADITQEAGVALGTFYVYFPDKLSLFVELVDELGSRLRKAVAAAVEGSTDRLETERRGLRGFFQFARAHRSIYRIVHEAEFVDQRAFRRYYERLADGYSNGLAEAMRAGQIRKLDPELLAYCLMGIGDFLGRRWVLWSSEDALEHVVEQAMSFIRHGIELPKGKRKTGGK